jgi:hypothetical protein
MRLLFLTGSLIAIAACAAPPAPTTAPLSAPFPGGALVDLSHTYDRSTVFWPTAESFRLDVVADGDTPAGYYYAANNFFSSEHGGTHLDAPVHFARGAQSVDQVPLDRLFGEAYLVDVTAAAAADADYQVTTADLQRAEAAQGPIPPSAILLLRTGFSQRWPDAARDGWWRTARSRPSGSTPPASISASRRCSSRTGCSTSATCRPSRT